VTSFNRRANRSRVAAMATTTLALAMVEVTLALAMVTTRAVVVAATTTKLQMPDEAEIGT